MEELFGISFIHMGVDVRATLHLQRAHRRRIHFEQFNRPSCVLMLFQLYACIRSNATNQIELDPHNVNRVLMDFPFQMN